MKSIAAGYLRAHTPSVTFVATIDERGQVVVPEEVLESLRLEPGASVEVEIRSPIKEQASNFDADRFNRWFERYRGTRRAEFLAQGSTSIEEYRNELRGR